MREARVLAMQALCQWDVQREESIASLRGFLAAQTDDVGLWTGAEKLVEAFWSRRPLVDSAIEESSDKWDLSRMSPVERNVMRVAAVEALEGLAPFKVSMDEAIEIAREYGGAESPRFVNGVLDRAMRKLLLDATQEE